MRAELLTVCAVAGLVVSLGFAVAGVRGWRRGQVSYRGHTYQGTAARAVAAVFLLVGAAGAAVAVALLAG